MNPFKNRYYVLFELKNSSVKIWCETYQEAIDIREYVTKGISKTPIGGWYWYTNGELTIHINHVEYINIEKQTFLDRVSEWIGILIVGCIVGSLFKYAFIYLIK